MAVLMNVTIASQRCPARKAKHIKTLWEKGYSEIPILPKTINNQHILAALKQSRTIPSAIPFDRGFPLPQL